MIENKKASIILILKVLQDYSDEDHYLTHQQIIDKVYSLYGIKLERKSVAYSIELLEELDYDINKGRHGGYALYSRYIDNTEAKFIIDAIFSSKAISGKQAKQLVNKIKQSLSIYQRKDYNYIYNSNCINRSENDQVFYSLDVINEAIKKHKRIGFQYIDYDEAGNKTLRMDGYQYIVSPYYLINSLGHYYLLCNYREKYHALQTFRLDYMTNIEVKDDWDIKPINSLDDMKGQSFDITSYINDHIYMLGGPSITADILIENKSGIKYIKDWFGKNAKLINKDGQIIYRITCNEKALIYWVMQYGEDIKVISPQSLIAKILDTAHQSFDKYLDKGEK